MPAPYVPMPNSFRRDLRAGRRLFVCGPRLTSNIPAEILGYAGFDWILIDGEHAPNDWQSFIAQLQALKDSPSAPIVRPQWAEPIILKRLLDIGFYNFLMPYIETADQARTVVAATRYPPQGTRGVGTVHRSIRYGYVPDYFSRINDDICVTVQIESREGVNNVEDIAAVEGVDALFIGPSDLSPAFGVLAQATHPHVVAHIERVVAA